MSCSYGKLFIVATPIGNLADLSDRARDILSSVDLVLAEDTRHSGKLLKHLTTTTPLKSYHDHNERETTPQIIQQLKDRKNCALISDAGTPLISDPGYHLVLAAHKEQIQVVPIPGPAAVIAALSVSGLRSERFRFEGFLPTKRLDRQTRFETLSDQSLTLIFYEAPHRILACLEDAINCFGGQRKACIVREMTKLYEDVKHGDLEELQHWIHSHPEKQKGEFVLLIEGVVKEKQSVEDKEAIRVLKILMQEHSTKNSAELAAKISGLKKNYCYKLALAIETVEE